MAKDTESVPDPLAESEEVSREEASSEEEDKDFGSESESEFESESKPNSKQTDNAHPINKPSSTLDPASKNPKSQTPDFSSSESESESKSESESVTYLTIKPIASKPVGNDQKVTALKKSKSKPNTASLSSLSKLNPTVGAKRPATLEAGRDGDVTETKRPKKKVEKEIERADKTLSLNDDSRKSLLRLWSEEDEIVILKGMTDFSANKKADPFANIDDFHEFIKKSIHVNVTRTQLQSKIRGLHKKYLKNADIEKQGKGKIFTNNHEQKVFALSKKVWSNETSTAGKSNGVLAKNVITKTRVIDFEEESNKVMKNSCGGKSLEKLKMEYFGAQESGIEEWIMKNSIQLVDVEKRAKIDEKWKRLRIEEAEMYSKKLELMFEETKLILDTLKSFRN